MSATFITWGVPAIALAMGGVACVWAWWGYRRFSKKYPDSEIAASYRRSTDV